MLAVTGSTGKSGSIFLQELVEHASEVTQMFTGGGTFACTIEAKITDYES